MKKIVAIFLSFVLMLSFTACGGNSNIMEFEPKLSQLTIIDTGEILNGSDEGLKGVLKIDLDNCKLEYSLGGKTYYGTMTYNEAESNSKNHYDIDWDKAPELVEDFDVYATFMYSFSDTTSCILYFCVEQPGYYDLLVEQVWDLK